MTSGRGPQGRPSVDSGTFRHSGSRIRPCWLQQRATTLACWSGLASDGLSHTFQSEWDYDLRDMDSWPTTIALCPAPADSRCYSGCHTQEYHNHRGRSGQTIYTENGGCLLCATYQSSSMAMAQPWFLFNTRCRIYNFHRLTKFFS
jgi:hypothetical protein